jgi:general nucleoside transport system ATP-binding protein
VGVHRGTDGEVVLERRAVNGESGTSDDPRPPALVMRGIVKRFGGVAALDGVDLTVRAGTVHALLGENGAGKTTLMRIAFGMIRPDLGSLSIEGAARRFRSVADSIAAGVGMVHQHYTLVPAMTVADNVALGLRTGYDVRAVSDRIRAIGAATGLALDPAAIVSDLSVEAQQRLEIIKALARDARLLILDEPTAVLAPSAAAEVLRWLRTFATGTRSVVLITHKLREALAVADDVTVLRRGRVVLSIPAGDATESGLADAMLGTASGGRRIRDPDRDAGPLFRDRRDAPVIASTGVTIADARGVVKLVDVSVAVYAGEIVGIAAVEGQGQHELLRAIAGRMPVASGTLTAPATVGFVPEDRQRDALVLDFPLYENVALRGAGMRRGRVGWRRIREDTRRLLTAFDVRASDADVQAATLSGGNQQKLVLARELAGAPPALVVENPTRGLDIQATAAVHERLLEARSQGCAVVFYASDVDEVLALADRVLVVAERTVREVRRDRDAVGRGMLGLGTGG